MAKINQKEYLKKYLSDGRSDHKRKKKRDYSDSSSSRVKIIDDNIDVSRRRAYDDDYDLILTGEDAPQIVGIVDDRPAELKTIEDFRSSGKWKTMASDGGGRQRDDNKYKDSYRQNTKYDQRRSKTPDRDYSPKRRTYSNEGSRSRQRSFEDSSPPRKKAYSSRDQRNPPASEGRDLSPVRRRISDDDLSPVRKSVTKKREDEDLSPIRKKPTKAGSNDDLSPVRKGATRRKSDDDLSPPRNDKYHDKRHRPSDKESRKDRREVHSKRKYNDSSDDDSKKMKRTLDGKRAGLQDAKHLKAETEEFRRRENEMFDKMSAEASGRYADVVVRDKKTGRIKDLEKESAKEKEKQELEKKKKEVYTRWGKGLKQIEEHRNKMEDEIHESNKPLARYSNDTDLEDMLRAQERIGDPMLEYIRQKERDKQQKSNAMTLPLYNGPFPENRFNIRPGYRWDGVDRSNGYEKKWFEVQNKKRAIQDEAYKYSTEDM